MSQRDDGDVQGLLRALRVEADAFGRVAVTWSDATAGWATARLGLEYLGGFVELIEDNGELCVFEPRTRSSHAGE